MQRPLIQDSVPDAKLPGKRVGKNTRLIEVDIGSGATREFVYPLDSSSNGVSEIVAINDRQFIVLERDSKPGIEAVSKRFYKIDISGVSDVGSLATLPIDTVPEGVVVLKKSLFLDLLDPKFKLAGENFPEKVEGVTFGPDLLDGRHLLIVAIDNDFVAEKPIILHAFAVDRGDVRGLVKLQARN